MWNTKFSTCRTTLSRCKFWVDDFAFFTLRDQLVAQQKHLLRLRMEEMQRADWLIFLVSGIQGKLRVARILSTTYFYLQLRITYTVFYEEACQLQSTPLGEEYCQKKWVGLCGPLPHTHTQFMTNICDFPCPIYDLTKHSVTNLTPLSWQNNLLRVLIMVLSEMIKSSFFYKTYLIQDECKTHTLLMTKMATIDTLFMTKTAETPFPLGPGPTNL